MTTRKNKELDLIDRNELNRQIRLYLNRHSLEETAVWTTLTIDEIASIISAIPTMNAKIEETANWLVTPVIINDNESWVHKCSKCDYIEVKSNKHEYSNYCSNCGRYMSRGN